MSDEPLNTSPAPATPKSRKMRNGCLAIVILVPLVLFTWCQYYPNHRFPPEVFAALQSDPQAKLYSIDPWPETEDDSIGMRGHKIIGELALSTQEDRRFIANQLAAATRGASDQMACFDPRHAVRAKGADGSYDILICFKCGQALVYFPNGQTETVLIRGKSKALDEFLKSHHVPLTDK